LEVVKNKKTKSREAFVDPTLMTKEWAAKLAGELEGVIESLKQSA
jgi:hypothetical protein